MNTNDEMTLERDKQPPEAHATPASYSEVAALCEMIGRLQERATALEQAMKEVKPGWGIPMDKAYSPAAPHPANPVHPV
jgi:hypothetical protein